MPNFVLAAFIHLSAIATELGASMLRPAGISYSVQAVGKSFPLAVLFWLPRRRFLHTGRYDLAGAYLPVVS